MSIRKFLVEGLRERGVFSQRLPAPDLLWVAPVIATLRRTRPDLVICSYGPPSAVIIAWISIRWLGLRVVMDYRDLFTLSHSARGLLGIRSLERRIDRFVLKEAHQVTTVSEGLARRLRAIEPTARVVTVYNCAEYGLVAQPRSGNRGDHSDERVVLTYFGSVNRWRDPSRLFRIMNLLQARHEIDSTRLVIRFASRNPGDFLAISRRYSVADYIEDLGEITRADAYNYQLTADAGLLLEAEEDNGALTGKLYEYLSCELPIIVVGPTKHSELGKLIDSVGAAAYYGDSEIAELIISLVKTPAAERRARKEARQISDPIARLSQQTLLELIHGIVG